MDSFIHNGRNVEIRFDKFNDQFEGFYSNGDKAFLIVFGSHGEYVKIYDFISYNQKQGLGTMVLLTFEEWAKKQSYKFIIGQLVESKFHTSPDKLKVFYSKRGYTVSESPGTDARIYKEL